MNFVSKNMRKMGKAVIAAYLGALSYNTPAYDYSRQIDVDVIPAHYFDNGVVAFTRLDGRIAMPEVHKVPYVDGVHSWDFVISTRLDIMCYTRLAEYKTNAV